MPTTPKRSVSHVYNEVSKFSFSLLLSVEIPLRLPLVLVHYTFRLRKLTVAMPPKNSVAHPPLGTLIDNDSLELVEVLGVGGYGVVYRSVDIHSSFSKSYAVKCLADPQPNQNGRRHLHIREITLHQLASSHPNVVTLHRVVEDYNHTYIIMDYASDGDLFSQILHSCRYLGDDYIIKRVFLQLLDAVEHCHSLGIYHRDLKPENVLCFDNGRQVAITDFGLATTDKVSEEFRTGSVYHMSPGMRSAHLLISIIPLISVHIQNVKGGCLPQRGLTLQCLTTSGRLLSSSSILPPVETLGNRHQHQTPRSRHTSRIPSVFSPQSCLSRHSSMLSSCGCWMSTGDTE